MAELRHLHFQGLLLSLAAWVGDGEEPSATGELPGRASRECHLRRRHRPCHVALNWAEPPQAPLGLPTPPVLIRAPPQPPHSQSCLPPAQTVLPRPCCPAQGPAAPSRGRGLELRLDRQSPERSEHPRVFCLPPARSNLAPRFSEQ